jgi:hypothetical protein
MKKRRYHDAGFKPRAEVAHRHDGADLPARLGKARSLGGAIIGLHGPRNRYIVKQNGALTKKTGGS